MDLIEQVLPSNLGGYLYHQDVFDDVVEAVMSILEEGRPIFDQIFDTQGLEKTLSPLDVDTNKMGPIIRGHRKQVGRYPCISVDETGRKDSWFATRVKRQDHNLTIQCKIEIVKMDWVEKYINVFGAAVQAWLNSFNNLQYYVNTVTGASVWDSWASDYNKGFSEDGSIRIANIPYRASRNVPTHRGA